MNDAQVTRADREAALPAALGEGWRLDWRLDWLRDWPAAGTAYAESGELDRLPPSIRPMLRDLAQAIATARAEGAAQERERCVAGVERLRDDVGSGDVYYSGNTSEFADTMDALIGALKRAKGGV